MSSTQQTYCACGECSVSMTGKPLMRFICHCEICQAVYQAPYADIVAIKSSQLLKPLSASIRFAKHRPPPAVARGICRNCKRPVVGHLALAPFFGISFIPAANFADPEQLPRPSLQTFCHRQISETAFSSPKAKGYWGSQWGLLKALGTALLSQD